MRGRLFAWLGAGLVLTASTSPASPRSAPHRATRTAARTTNASGVAAAAYLSGRQPLVGLHAPSDDPVRRDSTGRPMLALETAGRREFLAIRACADDGGFASIDLDRVAHLLRATGGEEHPIDPRVLSVIYRVETHFGVPEIRVVSAYRVPKPWSRSNHGRGRAVDLVVPGVADEEVAAFVRAMGFVGVGIYPSSQFVHVDVRPRSYFWVDFSKPRATDREHAILREMAARVDAAAIASGAVPVEPFGIATDVDAKMAAYAVRPTPADAAQDDDDDDGR